MLQALKFSNKYSLNILSKVPHLPYYCKLWYKALSAFRQPFSKQIYAFSSGEARAFHQVVKQTCESNTEGGKQEKKKKSVVKQLYNCTRNAGAHTVSQ